MPKQTFFEGQTATNPQTGQKIVFSKGRWHPVGAGGAMPGARPAGTPRLAPQEQKALADARSAASQFTSIADQATQFADINRGVATGPLYGVPVLGGAFEAAGEALNPKLAQLNALEARMAPQQREPGSGTPSDRDLALFLKAVPNTDRMGPANGLIAQDMKRMADKKVARSAFLDAYARSGGTLLGSEDAFEGWWAQNGEAWRKSRSQPRRQQTRKPAQGGGGWKVIGVED
jgi:hypothetical protein